MALAAGDEDRKWVHSRWHTDLSEPCPLRNFLLNFPLHVDREV